MFQLSRIDYFRRKLIQDARDAIFGPRYTMEGTVFVVPRGGPPAPRKAIARGTYEKSERDLIRAHLPPDLPVIELGGSFGIVSHTVRKQLLPGVPLIVVEANPHLVPICRANVALAGSVESTSVLHAVLAYGAAHVGFQLAENIHTSHLVLDGRTGPGIIDVPTVSIASLRQSHRMSGPFTIVCDIEGAELLLLRHDERALSDCHTIIMETHPADYEGMGGSLDEVMRRLAELGLSVIDRRENVIAAVRK